MTGLRRIVSEINRLSLSVDFLSVDDRQDILSATNSQVKKILGARIIDVRWKGTVSGASGILLNSIYSSNANPAPYYVDEHSQGIWSWMFLEGKGKGVWLENLHERNVDEPWPNKANHDKKIESKYLQIDPKTFSIVSVPLLFGEFTDTIWGAYTVEWGEFDLPDQDTWNQLEELATSIARIIWKTDTHSIGQSQTKNAIDLYRNAIISEGAGGVRNRFRSGFYVRPFREQFRVIEDIVARYLTRKGIQAQRFVNPGSGNVVIEDIVEKIRTSHFGIVDITGLNPNVLLECGMLIGLDRQVMFIRNHEDRESTSDTGTAEPFNIRPFEIHQYKALQESPDAEAQLQFWDPGENAFVPAEKALDRFVTSLLRNEEFRNAAEWTP